VHLLVWTLVVPLVTAAIGGIGGPRAFRESIMIGGLAVTFALSLAVAGQFLGGGIPAAFGDALRVDGLSALVLVLCAFVGLLSGIYGVGYLRRNEARGLITMRMRREFFGLMPAYVFAILLVSMSNNLGILWIAVELTTLASVFLVTFHDRDTSLEAAWKFLMLGSLGLAFALLGTVLLFASGQGHLGEGVGALNWTRLMQAAPIMHPFSLRLGVVFALIGYGTKAGLAPMHTWKPDAYGEAPSPAGVLMAVGMLNAALYCVLRIHMISSASLGPAFSSGLLLTLGLLSVLVATPFILIQWNLKRLLAYSSIEHVGIMAIGFGFGAKAGVFGALLHMTYHTLAKPVSFFSAGTLAQLHSSSNFDRIGNGTFTRTPIASGLFVLSAVMITGSPPFGLFFSEMTILRAGFVGSHVAATSTFLAALIVLFCGFAYQVGRLVLGPARDPADRRVPLPERFDLGTWTAIVAAALAIVSAFYLPGPLMALIHAATDVVWGGA
jgi:hydrogenase-4 component F